MRSEQATKKGKGEMKKAYILMQGHYGESYPLAIFTRKKDAVASAREGGAYKYIKNYDMFYATGEDESSRREIVVLTLLDKAVLPPESMFMLD